MPTEKSGVSLYNLSTWQSTFYIHGNLWYLTFAKKKSTTNSRNQILTFLMSKKKKMKSLLLYVKNMFPCFFLIQFIKLY